MGIHERIPPSHLEAECAVLGAMMINPDVAHSVLRRLIASDFSQEAHQTLYKALVHLHARAVKADIQAVCEALEMTGRLSEVGGASYVTSLIKEVPAAGTLDYYVGEVARTAVQRGLIAAAEQILVAAYEAHGESESLADWAEQRIFGARRRRRSLWRGEHLSDLLMGYIEQLEVRAAARQDGLCGVLTGFADLDQMTGGLQKEDLVIVAARSSTGLSGWGLSLARQIALHYGQQVGILSLKMSQEQMVARLLSMETGLPLHQLHQGHVEGEEWERIVEAMSTLSEAGIRMQGPASPSPFQIRSQARLWRATGLDLLIVDDLHLIQATENAARGAGSPQPNSAEIGRDLKCLACELGIPVVGLVPLLAPRASKTPQPHRSDVPAGLEASADLVLLLHRDEIAHPESERKGIADLIVAKHHYGSTGTFCLRLDPQTMRFHDPLDAPTVPLPSLPQSREEE